MFDLDGTLIDTAPQIAEAMNLALTDLGLNKLPISRITDYIGAGVDALIKRCLTDNLHDESDATLLEQAQAAFFVHYANNVTKSLPYHGVISGLRAVKSKDFKMACVTNKPERFTLPLLQASGLIDFFELVVSGDSLPKKEARPYATAIYLCKIGCINNKRFISR